MKKCVFSGVFDPPTVGHKYIIDTCKNIFDTVVVAVMENPEKQPMFSLNERLGFLKKIFAGERAVVIRTFDGVAADLLKDEKTPFYVRGVRNTVDFEYENQNYFASKKLNKDMVSIYIPCPQENLHISSTIVRNSIKFKKEYGDYIPKEILQEVIKAAKDKNVKQTI